MPASRNRVPTPTTVSTPPVVGACTDRASRVEDRVVTRRLGDDGRRLVETTRIDDDDVDVIATDLALERAGVAAGDDPAAVDDDDVVGEALGLVEVLRGEQDGGAAVDERVEHRPQLGARPWVETGGRFVEEEHLAAWPRASPRGRDAGASRPSIPTPDDRRRR